MAHRIQRTLETDRFRDAKSDTQAKALRDLSAVGKPIIYALRDRKEGHVKIGITRDLERRAREIGTDVLGFMFGTAEQEAEIHRTLAAHRARAREYYHPTAEVLAVVNDMRSRLGIEPINFIPAH